MKTVAIIQARMGSSRLPGKVLKKINNKTLLEYMLERVKQARQLDQIVIATTYKSQDTPIAKLARQLQTPVFRGKSKNVLDRFYQAAKANNAKVIIRLTADCPLIDPVLIDQCIQKFKSLKNIDYLSNRIPDKTYPSGMDIEVFSYKTLIKAFQQAHSSYDKEHVTSYLYHHPSIFKLYQLKASLKVRSQLKLSVDSVQDLGLIKKIIKSLYPKKPNFTYFDILNLLKATQKTSWFQRSSYSAT